MRYAIAFSLLAWFFAISGSDGTHWFGPYPDMQSCYQEVVNFMNICTTTDFVGCQHLHFDPNVNMQPTPTPT